MSIYINSANHCHLRYNNACLFLSPVTEFCQISSPNLEFLYQWTKQIKTWQKLGSNLQPVEKLKKMEKPKLDDDNYNYKRGSGHWTCDKACKVQSAVGSVSMQR